MTKGQEGVAIGFEVALIVLEDVLVGQLENVLAQSSLGSELQHDAANPVVGAIR